MSMFNQQESLRILLTLPIKLIILIRNFRNWHSTQRPDGLMHTYWYVFIHISFSWFFRHSKRRPVRFGEALIITFVLWCVFGTSWTSKHTLIKNKRAWQNRVNHSVLVKIEALIQGRQPLQSKTSTVTMHRSLASTSRKMRGIGGEPNIQTCSDQMQTLLWKCRWIRLIAARWALCTLERIKFPGSPGSFAQSLGWRVLNRLSRNRFFWPVSGHQEKPKFTIVHKLVKHVVHNCW